MTHNHENYEKRLAFVQDILHNRFGLKSTQIEPIQYDPDCPFKYNNFVYRVVLDAPLPAQGDDPSQPGCVPIPAGTSEIIMRLTNPDAEGMSPATRVENEVAIITLASTALASFKPHIVPSIYGWGSAAGKNSQGWILQKLMPGTPIDESFKDLDLSQKKSIFAQMASILKVLQDYKLPASIPASGGLTFDKSGQIINAAMTSVGAGPWQSYQESFESRLQVALNKADSNPYIKGWHANGVRERIDAFVEKGVPAQFQSLISKNDRAIIHADFTASNLLWDKSSGQITALIDYDFACILHPSYEFLRSFDQIGGQFRGWSIDEQSEQAALRDAKLNGFPAPLPKNTKDGVKWDEAKAWEDALEEVNVKRPRTIPGIDKVADVDTILRSILPWRVSNSDILRLQSDDIILQCRDENEAHLVKLLGRMGF